MPTISKMSIILSGDVNAFIDGLAKSSRELGKFTAEVKESGSEIGEIAGIFGVAFSADRFAEWIKGSMEAAEATSHLASTLGISTEAMGKLDYAAKLVDVSQDQIQAGMSRMAKALYEAQQGSKEVSDALADMGLNAGQLMALNPDEAFAKLADAIDSVNSPMQRLADAEAVFGRGAIQLLPLLEKGSAGIKAMGDEASRLGFALNEADAKKLEEANESIKKMEAGFQGIANQISADIAPDIKDIAGDMSGLLDIFRLGEIAVDSIRATVARLLSYTMEIPVQIASMEEKVAHLAGIHAMDENFAKIKGFKDGLNDVANDAEKSIGEAWDKIGKGATSMGEEVKSAHNLASESIAEHEQHLKSLAKAAEESRKKIDGMLESLRAEDATFGASDMQKKISEMANAGASAGQLAQAHAYADELDAKKQIKKLNDEIAADNDRIAQMGMGDLDKLIDKWRKAGMSSKEATDQALKDLKAKFDQDQKAQQKKMADDLKHQADQIYEQTRTPIEKLQERIELLKQMMGAHLIDADTFQRDLAKMVEAVEKQKAELGASPLASTFESGSEGAARYIAEFQMGASETKKDIAAEQQKQANDIAKQILEAIKNNAPIPLSMVTF